MDGEEDGDEGMKIFLEQHSKNNIHIQNNIRIQCEKRLSALAT